LVKDGLFLFFEDVDGGADGFYFFIVGFLDWLFDLERVSERELVSKLVN